MIRSLAKRSIDRLGTLLPARDRKGKSIILAYHNVVPVGSPSIGDRSLHLSSDKFERQLDLLLDEMEIVSLDHVLSPFDGGGPRAAITFDDAYSGSLKLGVESCIRRGVPCTVFVAPGLLGRVPHWDREANADRWSEVDRQYFLWKQRGLGEHHPWKSGSDFEDIVRIATKEEVLSVASSPLVSFAGHTFRHPNLAALTTLECAEEVRASADWLEALLGEKARNYVAYPYGYAPLEPRLVLEQTGLSFGFVASGMWFTSSHGDHSLVPRWNVPSGLSLDRFLLGLRGWYGKS